MRERYDVIGFGAHPDDLELIMGGTAAKLVSRGASVLFVDLCSGEPARHADPGVRGEQALEAARVLGVDRLTLSFRDRLIEDTLATRISVAEVVRQYQPSHVFTSQGSGVHPDHGAGTDAVVNGVFYARLPKWEQVPGGEALKDSLPHEIRRLFFGHCRMEQPWSRFDFAVDVTAVYDQKREAVARYDSVFGQGSELPSRFEAEDHYVGSLVGVRYAEPFIGRSPLLVEDPLVFQPVRYG